MKKILTAIVLFVFVALPMSVMAMQSITDNELSSVTGQAGVSINADVMVDLYVGTVAWGDNDGFTAASGTFSATNTGNAGWVGLTGLTAENVRIRLREDLIMQAWNNHVDAATFGATPAYQAAMAAFPAAAATFVGAYNAAYGTSYTVAQLATVLSGVSGDPTTVTGYAAFGAAYTAYNTALPYYNAYVAYTAASNGIQPIMIDVATDSTMYSGKTFVRIGLGSLEIGMASLVADVKTGFGATTPTMAYTLGSIYMKEMLVNVNRSSYVDIYQGGALGVGQGVGMTFNVVLDNVNFTTIAWGDSDGLTNNMNTTATNLMTDTDTTNQGWVGLKTVRIAGLSISGSMGIDVATDSNYGGATYVNISLNGLGVGMTSMSAIAALGADAKSATGLNQELGSINLSNMTLSTGGSVKIYAPIGGSGVRIDLNITNTDLNIASLSWGDADGLAGAAINAGYVGLTSLAIDNLTLSGFVTIDVATLETAVPGNWFELMYAAYPTHQMSPSFVHIGFGTGNGNDDPSTTTGYFAIGLNTLTANVRLASNAALSAANAGTLGSIYMSTVSVKANGWVDIAAH